MRVTNTILEARAQSTRHLCALKWPVFSDCWSAQSQDPISCDMSHVLTFLLELLDKNSTPSTLKVYVAAIAASHSLVAGWIVGRIDLVIKVLRGAWKLNPPLPRANMGLVFSPNGPLRSLLLSCFKQPAYGSCRSKPLCSWP